MARSKSLAIPLRLEVTGSASYAVFDVFDAANDRHLGFATLHRDQSMSPETFKRLVEILESADG